MTFSIFSCDIKKLKSVGLSEIVLESFPDSDNFGFFSKTTCTKKAPRDTITLEGLQIKITTEVNRGF